MDRQDLFASIQTNASFASVVVAFRHCGLPKSSPDHATRISRASVDWQAGGTFVLELSVRNSCYDHILITLQSRHTLTMVSRFCHSRDEISAS
jgi:hypothetical protein